MSLCDIKYKMFTACVKKRAPLLKKREDEWSHEIKKADVIPELSFPVSYGDRFIPRRYLIPNREINAKLLYKSERKDVVKSRLSAGYWRNESLKLAINGMFGIKERRILEFKDLVIRTRDNLLKENSDEFIYGCKRGLDWPCRPRNKPLAFADTTHDLPGFDSYSDLNIIDWCMNGQIAASFGRDLVLWSPESDLTMVYKISCAKALSYCPNGKYLAVGCKKRNWPVFELWHLKNNKHMLVQNGYVFSCKYSEVRCIEWSQCGKVVICGTEVGNVTVFNVPELTVMKKIKDFDLPVFMIKFSPTNRYLAACDTEGNIMIYNWISCDVHVMLRSQRKLRAVISWHPWNGTDIAISEDMPASIVILNVPSKEIVAYYQRKDYNCQIDSIIYSKITAELVVSYSIKNPDGCVSSEILIMSSLDRVVDILKIEETNVRFMMWSPNGMQLATSGNDETLTIWNFLPSRYVKKQEKANATMSKSGFKEYVGLDYGKLFSRLNTMR